MSGRDPVGVSRILPGVIGAIVLLAASATLALSQARDVQQPAPAPTGTGRITGQVVAADSGAPVRHAQVTLMGTALSIRVAGGGVEGGIPGPPPGMVRKQAETDDGGGFSFTDLPAGQFTVMVAPPTGFVRPDHSANVRLTDGQSSAVTIKLDRAGAITGRVLDESGEPLARVNVRAMRRDASTGGQIMSVGANASTDDLGHFRLYGLSSGDYYVTGTSNGPQGVAFADPGTTPTPRMGYGPTYYPGSSRVEEARKVTVRAGQDTGGIEFQMQRVQLGRVLGTAVDSAGRPLTGRPDGARGSVMLTSHDEPNSGRGGVMRPDGTFEIINVTPGEYDLVAMLQHGDGSDSEREGAFVPVTVNGNDVTMSIQTNTGATLSGRVIVEGRDAAAALTPPAGAVHRTPTTVSAHPGPNPTSFIGSYPRSAEVADDGGFELKGLRGRSIVLTANNPRAILKAVLRGGQDVTAKPMLLRGTERVTDIQILLTTDVAILHGVVTNSSGESAPDVTVIVFPDDPDRWFQASPFIVLARTLASVPTLRAQRTAAPGQPPTWAPVVGGFSVGRLLPGRYFVAALPGTNASMSLVDRESLQRLSATAASVTLGAGEPVTVQVRLPK
jgi:hypothetical protein